MESNSLEAIYALMNKQKKKKSLEGGDVSGSKEDGRESCSRWYFCPMVIQRQLPSIPGVTLSSALLLPPQETPHAFLPLGSFSKEQSSKALS
jgi:hypothetical protein